MVIDFLLFSISSYFSALSAPPHPENFLHDVIALLSSFQSSRLLIEGAWRKAYTNSRVHILVLTSASPLKSALCILPVVKPLWHLLFGNYLVNCSTWSSSAGFLPRHLTFHPSMEGPSLSRKANVLKSARR